MVIVQKMMQEYASSLRESWPPVTLTVEEAIPIAERLVRDRVEPFTSADFFSGLRLRADKRGRGAIIKHLQRAGLITLAGYTTKDQERRNYGIAALWMVTEW